MRTLAALIVAVILTATAVSAVAGAPKIGVARIDGGIDPATASYIERCVKEAEKKGYECLIITIDTPGGLMDSMDAITQTLLNASIPTVTYVYPKGAQSKSAGLFVMYASDIAAMAPATSMGSAHPVILPLESDPSGQIATMVKKVEQSATAQIRAIAERRGRNADWAQDAVRTSVSVTEKEALKKNAINLIANDMTDLLAQLNGIAVQTGGKHNLNTKGAVTVAIPMSAWEQLLHFLSNANVAYLLLLIAIWGVIFELSNPGAIVPGAIGAIALITAIYSFSVLSINIAGLVLIALAIVMFIVEIKAPTHGLLTAGGVVAFAYGSFLLFQTPDSFARVSISLIGFMTVATTLFFVLVVSAGILAQRRGIQTGAESIPGKQGEARSDINAEDGMAFVDGQLWTARSVSGEIPNGAPVEIVDFDGMIALVRGIDQEPGASS